MSRLTRDGTAEPVSRDQILRHARGQGNIHFPCSADHEQDWQPYPVDPYSAICDDHTYIHTNIIPEQGPDLVSGTVTTDDDTFTTLPSITSGVSATSSFSCRALLDTGSPQSFIHQGAFDQMIATGAADESYVRATTPRSWSSFGSQELLSINRQARMIIQLYHNNTPSASLAVWMYIVPNKTMRCPLLLGRDSWMRFHTRSY